MRSARLPPDTRILVIDDSAAVRARMEAYLGRLGYTDVRSAASVKEGLDSFHEAPASVVFLDLVIDEERGLDFAAPILAEAPLTDIVVMSALSPNDAQVTEAIAQGARDFLAKPVTFPSVESVLVRLASDLDFEAPTPPRRDDASYQ